MFVVVEAAWESNDEYYYRAGARSGNSKGMGTPQKVFADRAKAEAEALKLNIKHVKGVELYHYSEEPFSLIDDAKMDTFLEILGLEGRDFEEISSEELQIPTNLSDKKAAQVLDCLDITWYEVVEVDA